MKTLNGKEILAVEVPDNAYDFTFRRLNQIIYLIKGTENPFTGFEKSEITIIPNTSWRDFDNSQWTILGRPSEISEEYGITPEWCKANGITDKHILLIKK